MEYDMSENDGEVENFDDCEFIEAMPLHLCIKGMSIGTVMYKLRSAEKWYRRKYKVDVQNMRLTYSPSTKPFWRNKITTVDLYDLEDVRKGWTSDVFNKVEARMQRRMQARLHPQLSSMLKEENCFSLVIRPGHTVIDLVAPSPHACDAWVRGLSQLMACCKYLQTQNEEERWLKDQVRKADVNKNGSLNFEECLGLLNQLNIWMRRREAKKLFDEANFRKVKIDGEDALEPDEFVEFYRSLIHRPELEELMKKYSVSKSCLWGPEELSRFLKVEQKMTVSFSDCEAIIEEHEPEANKIPGYLSLQGFTQMMLSPDHSIFNKEHRIIYQDMTRPLTDYYIATSHNTYLISGQLIGDSSIEGYIQALMRGCRCLELDIWDGSDGEPIIYHGYTLTSRIFFRDVLEAIKKYAFKGSQYPVILSIENHCSLPYQKRMAYHFTNILGEYLYKDPVGEDETKYPSPEALARKILIKGKKLKSREEWTVVSSEEYEPGEEDKAVPYTLPEASNNENAANLQQSMTPPGEKLNSPKGMKVIVSEEHQLEEEEDRDKTSPVPMPDASVSEDAGLPQPMAAPAHAPKLAPELSDLVNYFAAHHFDSFAESRVCWKFFNMASFSESAALTYASEEGADFVAHNRRHMSRIYPKGTRTDSTNYDPVPYWNVGCQLVALNYQTWDGPMYTNEAKFAQNGRCGYILKPKYLTDEVPYDPSKSPYPDQKVLVTIKIISAQFLPKPNREKEGEVIDPYVSVKVVGHPLDNQKEKTNFIANNGFNPMWNKELKFTLNAPEEAIFHFRVKDDDLSSNELIGQFALPFLSINEGYRHIQLEDASGERLERATLFVHTELTKHIQYKKTSTNSSTNL